MGGKKKLSLSKMEKLHARNEREKREKRKERSEFSKEKHSTIFMPEIKEDVIDELKKMKVLTPFSIASRFNLKVSVAKDFLEELEKRGLIEFISRSRKTRIYAVAA